MAKDFAWGLLATFGVARPALRVETHDASNKARTYLRQAVPNDHTHQFGLAPYRRCLLLDTATPRKDI